MKTKEEILKGCEHDGAYIPVNEVKRVMDEYAKSVAMDFAEWCDEQYWSRHHGDKNKDLWYNFDSGMNEYATTAELFAKFDAERNQQQSELTCPKCLSNRILEWPDKYQCRKCEHVWERSAK